MKQNPQLIFINRKGVRHLPSGIPPAPKSQQQPGKTRVYHEGAQARRAAGPERSAALCRIIILLLIKLIRAPPGLDSPTLLMIIPEEPECMLLWLSNCEWNQLDGREAGLDLIIGDFGEM